MKYHLLIFTVFPLLFLHCADSGVEPPPPQMRALTISEQKLVEANGKFWLKLLQEVNKEDAAKNVFISPLSISFALGMTLNGAEGETYQAMRSTLGFADMPLEEINASFKSLMQTLTTVDPKVQMQIANSIWYREGFPVESDFINVNRTYFDAVVRALNFSSPDAARTINAWVNEKTNGKISEIIESDIPDEIVLYLMNALYFKGGWTHRFKPDETRDDRFTLQDGSKVPCKMMNQRGSFSMVSNQRFIAVDLPYAYRIFSMTILLPQPEFDINAFVSSFTQAEWQHVVENLSEQENRFRW